MLYNSPLLKFPDDFDRAEQIKRYDSAVENILTSRLNQQNRISDLRSKLEEVKNQNKEKEIEDAHYREDRIRAIEQETLIAEMEQRLGLDMPLTNKDRAAL